MIGYLDALEERLRGVPAVVGHPGRPFRLVVTGSRDGWGTRPAALARSLETIYVWYGSNVRLSHGAARGIDRAADVLARAYRWQVMQYPVSEREWAVYRGYAGHQRNARMLEAERPDLVLALIWRGSRGSTGCADNAAARGAPVVRIDEELALLPRCASL